MPAVRERSENKAEYNNSVESKTKFPVGMPVIGPMLKDATIVDGRLLLFS